MNIFKWVVVIIAATVLFIGVGVAGSLTKTIAGTAGSTGGLLIGGIPTLVTGFKTGMSAGGGTGGASTGGAGGNGGAAWTGGINQWTGPVTPTAPAPGGGGGAAKRPQTAPVAQPAQP